MYKYLLCWRYLRTRYIALASVVSVMLGVATMIVVNSVMAGFADMMRTRLHGVLADIVVESYDLDGFANYREVMARIKEVAGDQVEAMAPTMETFGLMKITFPNGNPMTRYVQIMGVRPEERAQTGEFASFLQDEHKNPVPPSFEVSQELRKRAPYADAINQNDPNDPYNKYFSQEALDAMPDRGAIIGYALATIHMPGSKTDEFVAPRGTKISLAFAAAGKTPQPGFDEYTVVGYFKSGMSEYDSMHVYVPLERLQKVRNLGDGKGNGRVNQIQIKAKAGVDLDALAHTLQAGVEPIRPLFYRVRTWKELQGPLLAAVQVEQNILNMLLFFIIAVAGFGILAIFSMIVVEKTRDIGILKALGASTAGVRNIFLGYGLSLGLVGSGVGIGGGLLFVYNINQIEKWLSSALGRKIFDDSIYYFNEIPTLVELSAVLWILFGTLLITVAASIWPAQRAARLQPVQALRFE